MKKVTVNTYKFNELADNVKQKLIDAQMVQNVENEDFDFILYDFVYFCEDLHIYVNEKDIYYRCSYSQGDGSSFESSLYDFDKFFEIITSAELKNISKELYENVGLLNIDARVLNLIKNNYIDVEICTKNLYNCNTMNVDFNYYFENDNKDYKNIENEMLKFKKYIDKFFDSLNDILYKNISDYYDFITNDTNIIKQLEEFNYDYIADGTIIA